MLEALFRTFEPSPRTAEDWIVRLGRERVTPRDRAAFEAWLARDPRNRADYEALADLLAGAEALKLSFDRELRALSRRPRTLALDRRWLFAGAGAGAVAAAAAVVVIAPGIVADPGQTFVTATGEIRDVVLADGSRVTLDTASAIRVHGRGRRVVLERGVAYFDVAHDAGRPFTVDVADRQVVVTGTRFTTALLDGEARVALLQGGVRLTHAGGEAARLTPGDQVAYRARGPLRREARIDPARAASWRERRLTFENIPLDQALTMLSRYTDVRLRVADPRLARLRVTAVFPLDDPQPLLERIDRMLPVSVTLTAPGMADVRAD